jgi:aldose 1-epimerase
MDDSLPTLGREHRDGLALTVLREPSTGSEVRIAPDIGANCASFRTNVDGQPLDVIRFPDSIAAFRDRPTYFGTAVLFPFPGRIRGGRLRFAGTDYQLPINEPSTGNAIHGCVAKQPWIETSSAADSAGVEVTHTIDTVRLPALLNDFPFPFRLTMKVRLSAGVLSFRFLAENIGAVAMPVGLGVHPYFPLPLGTVGAVDDCEIWIDAPHYWEQENFMPVGYSRPVEASVDLRTPRTLRALASVGFGGIDRMVNFTHSQFSDTLGPGPGPSGIRWGVRNPKARREVIVEGDPSFPASVTYIPTTREKVSFEPHTCLPNAFNLANEGKVAGQITLGPSEFWRGSFQIRARAIDPG